MKFFGRGDTWRERRGGKPLTQDFLSTVFWNQETMATSPFELFRRNLKPLMIALTILAMLAFVVLPAVDSWMRTAGPAGQPTSTVASYDGGEFNRREVNRFTQNHYKTLVFLQTLANKTIELGGMPAVPGFNYNPQQQQVTQLGISSNPSTETAVTAMLYAKRAQELGLELDHAAVKIWLRQFVDEKLTDAEIAAILRSATDRSLGQYDMLEQLRIHLLGNAVQQTSVSGLFASNRDTVPPAEKYGLFLRLNQRASAVAYPVLVDDFLDQTDPNPPAEKIKEVYEAGKDLYPDQERDTPGFRQRATAVIEVVSGDVEAIQKRLASELPEETIREEYEKQVASGAFRVPSQEAEMGVPEGDVPVNQPAKATGEGEAAAEAADKEMAAEADPANEAEADAKKPEEAAKKPEEDAESGEPAESAEEAKPDMSAEPQKPEAEKPETEKPETEKPAEPADAAAESEVAESEMNKPSDGDPAPAEEPESPAEKTETPAEKTESPAEPKAEETPAEPKAEPQEGSAEETPPAEPKPSAADETPDGPAEPATEKPEAPQEEAPQEEAPGEPEAEEQAGRAAMPVMLVAVQEEANQPPPAEGAEPETQETPEPAAESGEAKAATADVAPQPDPQEPKSEEPAAEEPAKETPEKQAESAGPVEAASEAAAAEPADPAMTEPAAGQENAAEADASEAAGNEADASAEPAEKVQPFEEVREQLAMQLVNAEAFQKAREGVEQVRQVMRDYSIDRAIYEQEQENGDVDAVGAEPPTPPDLKKLAEELGLKYEKIGPHDMVSIGETPVGQSLALQAGGGQSFAEVMFRQEPMFTPVETMNFRDGSQFVSWKVRETEDRVPTLDEVKDEVVSAIRFQQAQEIAKVAAEELATEANASDKPLEELVPEDRRQFVYDDLGEFTWMQRTGPQGMPLVWNLEELNRVGDRFMRQVFTRPLGQYNAAPNEPGTVYYVVKTTRRGPEPEELYEQFVDATERNLIQSMVTQETMELSRAYQEKYVDQLGLEWSDDEEL